MVLACIGGLASGWAIVWLLSPSLGHPPEISRRIASGYNLKAIGLAIHNYNVAFHELPAPATYVENGAASHGWPVALLPYLDQKALYESIDLTKPHTDPANVAVMSVNVPSFSNPLFDDRVTAPEMHYALSSRIFRDGRGLSLEEITDGTSNTFLGGEIAQGIQRWSVPGHLRDPGVPFNTNEFSFGTPLFGNRYYSGTQMLMMDGSVVAVSDDIDPAVREALSTPDAGDDATGFR